MPKRKVLAASLPVQINGQWTRALRGEVIELSDEEIKRLAPSGLLAAEDAELERPGKLVALNENATDEHIHSYLASGNIPEILAQLEEYPLALRDKLAIAERSTQNRGHLVAAIEGRPEVRGIAPAAAVASTPKPVLTTDEAVAQNGPEVIAYATEYPEQAEALLAAEEAGKNRSTVVAELTKLIEG